MRTEATEAMEERHRKRREALAERRAESAERKRADRAREEAFRREKVRYGVAMAERLRAARYRAERAGVEGPETPEDLEAIGG